VKNLSIKEINKGLANKDFSAVEITESFLAVIKEKDKEIET